MYILSNKFSKTFSDIATSWGRTENDIHIINPRMDAGTEGKDGYYNTYHYEKRYIFHMIGDVEFVSGSGPPSFTAITISFPILVKVFAIFDHLFIFRAFLNSNALPIIYSLII